MKKFLLSIFLALSLLSPSFAALSDNLISFWPMNEASGNGADLAGTNTLVDNATVTSNPGKVYALARQFTAANLEYFSVADNASISVGGTAFSYAVWVWIDTIVAADTVILAKDVGADGEYDLILQGSTAGSKFYAQTWTGTSHAGNVIVAANNFGAPTANSWNLVVFTSDQTTNKISVNAGTQNTAAAASAGWNSTSAFSIGRYGGGAYFGGKIGPVMFWKKALTTTEITQLFNNGAGLTYQGLLGTGIIMHPLTSGASTTNASSYTTSSVTIHANRLAILGYQNARDLGSAGVPTPTMTGVTWTLFPSPDHISYHTAGTPTRRVTAFWAYPASDQTGTILIDHGGNTQDGAAWSVVEFEGTAAGASGIVQSAANSGGSGAVQVTCTLSAFGDATNNATYGVFGTSQAAGIAPDAGFVEIHDQTYATPSNEIESLWRNGQNTAVKATFGAADCGCVAAEIKAFVAGPSAAILSSLEGEDDDFNN